MRYAARASNKRALLSSKAPCEVPSSNFKVRCDPFYLLLGTTFQKRPLPFVGSGGCVATVEADEADVTGRIQIWVGLLVWYIAFAGWAGFVAGINEYLVVT